MKKILMCLLVLCLAAPANAQIMGWNDDLDTVIDAMRAENPDNAFYSRIPDTYKYLSGDPSHGYSFTGQYKLGTYCGRQKIPVSVNTSTEYFTKSSYYGYENVTTGRAIKFIGDSLPGGIDSSTTYYMVDAGYEIVPVTANTTTKHLVQASGTAPPHGSRVYLLADTFPVGLNGTTLYFVTERSEQEFGVTSQDGAIKIFFSTAGSNVRYYSQSYKRFKVSLTPGGSPIDITSEGTNYGYYGADESLYAPSGCKDFWTDIDPNGMRAGGVGLALEYAQMYDSWTEQQKKDARSAMDRIVDTALWNPHPGYNPLRTGFNDSDQLIGQYFMIAIYAAALQDQGFTDRYNELVNNAEWGGWTPTENNTTSSWRNSIYNYFTEKQKAVYLESSDYNMGTMDLFIKPAYMLNEFLGEDHFPEITSLFDDFGDWIKYEYWNNLGQSGWGSFAWGDTEHQLVYPYNALPLISLLATINDNDPELWYLFDKVNFYRLNYSGITALDYYPYYNPYATRADDAAWQSHGWSYHNDDKRGVQWTKAGWEPNDPVFWSQAWRPHGVDHGTDVNNWSLYRNGKHIFQYPAIYTSTVSEQWTNALLVFGNISTHVEDYGQVGFFSDATKKVTYHVASAAGRFMDSGGSQESVHEMTREYFYRHNADGSDTIILNDRVDTIDPRTVSGYTNIYFEWTRRFMEDMDFYHQWCLHLPTGSPTTGTDTWQWTVGTDTVRLRTFMPDYTSKIIDQQLALRWKKKWDVTANSSTDVITISSPSQYQVVENGRPIKFYGTAPGGLNTTSTYYMRDVSGSTFKVASIAGGSAIDITSAGASVQYNNADTQVPDLTNAGAGEGAAGGDPLREFSYQLRLIPNERFSFQTLLNAIHVTSGSAPTYTQINESSGADIDGLLIEVGSEKYAVIYNKERGDLIAPQPNTPGPAADTDRRLDADHKRRLKDSTTFTIPTTSAMTLYVTALDNEQLWDVTIDGVTTEDVPGSSQGMNVFDVSSSGSNHVITLAASGEPPPEPTCDDICGLCMTPEECSASTKPCYSHSDGSCQEEEEPDSCNTRCDLCNNPTECAASLKPCFVYQDNSCNDSGEPVSSPKRIFEGNVIFSGNVVF